MSPESAAGAYPRTYRMAPWALALLGVMGAALCALGAVPILLVLRAGAARSGSLTVLVIAFAACAALGAYLIAVALRSKVVLTEEAIAVHGLVRVRRLARADIAGRRILSVQYGQKLLLLSAKTAGVRDLKINLSSQRRDALWDAWMGTLPDLDAEEARAFEAGVAANAELGQTPEERLGRLAAARRTATALNVSTYAAAAWGYLYPRPYGLAMLALAVLPWLAIVMAAKSCGLYRIDSRRADPRPSLALPVILPGLVLLMRALQDVAVLDLERALIFAAVTAVALTWALLMSDAAERARRWTALLWLGLGCAYGYGAVVLANSELDTAAGELYRVEVLSRHVSRGSRSTSYYLLLDRWGPRRAPGEVSVTRELYQRAEPGTLVCVHRGPGALGISWFEVGGCSG